MSGIQGLFDKLFRRAVPQAHIEEVIQPEVSPLVVSEKPQQTDEELAALLASGLSAKQLVRLITSLPIASVSFEGVDLETRRYLSKADLAALAVKSITQSPEERRIAHKVLHDLEPGITESLRSRFDDLAGDVVEAASENNAIGNRPEQAAIDPAVIVGDLSRDTSASVQERDRRKRTRRRISGEFQKLLAKGVSCDEKEIIDFYIEHSGDFQLMKEAVEPSKRSTVKAAVFIWALIDKGSTTDQDPLILQRRLRGEKQKQIEARVPMVMPVGIRTTPQGPELSDVDAEAIQHLVVEYLGEPMNVAVRGELPFRLPGEYPVQLDFDDDISTARTIRLEYLQEPLPLDLVEGLKGFLPSAPPDSILSAETLKRFLSNALRTDLEDYFPRLSSTIIAAYQSGHWANPWVQELVEEWRDNLHEYQHRVNVRRIRNGIERINQRGPWILPRDLDSVALLEERLLVFAESIVSEELHGSKIELRLSGDINQPNLPVEILYERDVLGVLSIQRRDHSRTMGKEPLQPVGLGRPPITDGEVASRILQLHRDLLVKDVVAFESRKQILNALLQIEAEIDRAPMARTSTPVPLTQAALLVETKNYRKALDRERAEAFLGFAKTYLDDGNSELLKMALAQYCFARGRQTFHVDRKASRPYFLLLICYQRVMGPDYQREIMWEFLSAIGFYLRTFNIDIDTRAGWPEIVDIFYSSFPVSVARSAAHAQQESLGRCIVDIHAANPSFIYDLINRLKNKKEYQETLDALARSLQEPRVFRLGPTPCINLLGRMNPRYIGTALSIQNLSNADQKRQLVNGLLTYLMNAPVSIADVLGDFSDLATSDTKNTLAFSTLVEPFLSGSPDKEASLKVALTIAAFDLESGTPQTEVFAGMVRELVNLFDKFDRALDPTVKSSYGTFIQNRIRLNRRFFVENFRKDRADLIIALVRSLDSYIVSEVSKLIRSTTLEIALINDRALYVRNGTRVTIEIRNIGEGMADGVELHLMPVPGQYDVDERYRITRHEVLTNKVPVQLDVQIMPLVGINETIDLSVELKYDTLEKKENTTSLAENNRKILLYPETQFVRIPQRYTIGGPATTWFYGRHELLDLMADNLRHGSGHDTSMIVYGLRRAGKTSVVKRFIENTLISRELDQHYLPVYSDLLIFQTADLLPDERFLAFLRNTIAGSLKEYVANNHLTEPGFLSGDSATVSYVEFRQFVKEACEYVGDKRFLIVIDEFSKLSAHIRRARREDSLSEELFGFLSNLIQGNDQLTFVFTGTYILHETMRRHAQDIAKICQPRLVGILDEVSARQLVTEPVALSADNPEVGFMEYDPRVVDRIIESTGCHPYLIQFMCSQLVDRMNNLKYNRVNLSDINSVIADIVVKPSLATNVSIVFWDELDSSQHKILSVLASKSVSGNPWTDGDELFQAVRQYDPQMLKDEYYQTCSRLVDAELIERSPLGESNSYRICIPLYELWIKANRKPTDVFANSHNEDD